jgi:hypothetical protein
MRPSWISPLRLRLVSDAPVNRQGAVVLFPAFVFPRMGAAAGREMPVRIEA